MSLSATDAEHDSLYVLHELFRREEYALRTIWIGMTWQIRAGRVRIPICLSQEQQIGTERLEAGLQEGDVCVLRGLDF